MRGAQRREQSKEAAMANRRDLETLRLLEGLAESSQDPRIAATANRLRMKL